MCGCNLKKGRGRLKGTTIIKGYGVGASGRRLVGTTAEEEYGVSPGRPVGTTEEEGMVLVWGDLWVPNTFMQHAH